MIPFGVPIPLVPASCGCSRCRALDRDPPVGLILELLAEGVPSRKHLVHLLSVMEGIAFARRIDHERDQMAWDACVDPMEMFGAVGITRSDAAVCVLAHAVLRYRERVMASLDVFDPMNVKDRIDDHVPNNNVVRMVLALIQIHSAIRPRAAAEFCSLMRRYLPVPPWGFAGLGDMEHGEVIELLCGLPEGRTKPEDRQWVGGLAERFRMTGKLTVSQRGLAELMLRHYVGWNGGPRS